MSARTEEDLSLSTELKSSALLFMLAIASTAGAVAMSQLALRVLS